MGEKKFIIYEVDEADGCSGVITLSELVHRINRIRREDRPIHGYIDIFLHGEGYGQPAPTERGCLHKQSVLK